MKQPLRERIKRMLATMPPELAEARSVTICTHVTALAEFSRARTVMVYLAIAGEVDPTGIAQAAWSAGKTVVVPKVSWHDRSMAAIEYRSLDEHMDVDRFGIRTPRQGSMVAGGELDMVVVPGLAFDRRGHRLGRGGGFYDRFLPGLPQGATLVAVAFDEQVVDDLPVDEHDHPVDMLVTEREVLRFAPARTKVDSQEV